MMKKFGKIKWLQVLRFLVQALFLGLCIAGIISSKHVSEMLLPTILLFGVFFCGWVCMFGTLQEWAYKLGRLLHLPVIRVPQKLQQYLQLSRYVFYFLSMLGISFAVLHGTRSLGTLLKGKELATVFLVVLILFFVVGLFFNRPFCNYFCVGGAKRGMLSVMRVFGIRRDTSRCGNCGLCTKACPMNIDVANTEFVRHPNCIGCLSCISACPKGCVAYRNMPAPKQQGNKAK